MTLAAGTCHAASSVEDQKRYSPITGGTVN
jgi:hypothetical protein